MKKTCRRVQSRNGTIATAPRDSRLCSELPPKSRTGVRRAWSVSGYQVHRMFRNTELLKIAACVPLGSSLSLYCERKDKGTKS